MCINCDDCYFIDIYQVMLWMGYVCFFKVMFVYFNIFVMLNIDYCDVVYVLLWKYMVYIGLIDVFFEYCFGYLFYCSL